MYQGASQVRAPTSGERRGDCHWHPTGCVTMTGREPPSRWSTSRRQGLNVASMSLHLGDWHHHLARVAE